MMTLPLAIGGVCIITSIVGTFFVKLGASQSIMGALYKGLIATGVLSLVGVAGVIYWLIGFGPLAGVKFTGMALFECGVVGLAVTGLIIWITEYYTGTDYRPVKSIAASSVTGHGTNVIQGLAISMESTALPAIVIIAGILVTYSLAGLFGIAIATTTMLALAGMVVALDAFGPVTDNAGGIAEMAGLPKEVRKSTDALDAVGNTTKAVTKGYAIGSAGLGALVLFAAYNEDLKFFIANCREAPVLPGRAARLLAEQPLRRGRPAVRRPAAVPVRRDGHDRGRPRGRRDRRGSAPPVPREARHHEGHRQAGLRPRRRPADQGGDQGNDHPVAAAGAVADRRLLRDLRDRGRRRGRQVGGFSAVGAMLLGVIVTGLFVAISMTSGGGAWDNAKKYIEDGHYGGKGSDAHKAAVTGDTVGDPYKDTAGPGRQPDDQDHQHRGAAAAGDPGALSGVKLDQKENPAV